MWANLFRFMGPKWKLLAKCSYIILKAQNYLQIQKQSNKKQTSIDCQKEVNQQYEVWELRDEFATWVLNSQRSLRQKIFTIPKCEKSQSHYQELVTMLLQSTGKNNSDQLKKEKVHLRKVRNAKQKLVLSDNYGGLFQPDLKNAPSVKDRAFH